MKVDTRVWIKNVAIFGLGFLCAVVILALVG